MDEGFRSAQQRTVARKPNRLEGPEALLIEVRDLRERIELAAVGVAGVIEEFLEFAKNRDVRLRAQDLLELRQCGDPAPAQELPHRLGGESNGTHNAIVPPPGKAFKE